MKVLNYLKRNWKWLASLTVSAILIVLFALEKIGLEELIKGIGWAITLAVMIPLGRNAVPIALLFLLLSSCTSYERLLRKYTTKWTDTTYIEKTVVTMIPRDSAVLVLDRKTFTDTSQVTVWHENNRAKVIVEKYRDVVTVKAECDTIYKKQIVRVGFPPQPAKIGVAPWYKKGFWYAAGLLAILGGALFLSLRFGILTFRR